MRISPIAIALAMLGACGSGGGPSEAGAPGSDGAAGARGNAPVSGMFGGTLVQFEQCEVVYDHTTRMTTLTAQHSAAQIADQETFTLFFLGNSSGHFACSADGGGVDTGFTYGTANASYSSTGSPSLTPCQIDVASYGPVGGIVAGTFSGVVFATSTKGGAPATTASNPERTAPHGCLTVRRTLLPGAICRRSFAPSEIANGDPVGGGGDDVAASCLRVGVGGVGDDGLVRGPVGAR